MNSQSKDLQTIKFRKNTIQVRRKNLPYKKNTCDALWQINR